MACSPSSSTPLDLQLAASAGLHSLHSFISLISSAAAFSTPTSSSASASASSSLQHLLQHQQSMAASETIAKFKHLATLLSPRQGHARVRHAPHIAAAPPCADFLHHSCTPDPSAAKPNSPLCNPNFPSLASDECFQFSQRGNPAASNCGSGSTSFEECVSIGVEEEEHSIRGSSHIDLNNQANDYDYLNEGSVNNKFSRRAFYNTEDIGAKDNYPNFITNDEYTNKNKKLDANYGSPSIANETNPFYFDLNQQAPSLESTSETSHVLTACSTNPPLFCPHPLPSHEESFSFDVHTQSAVSEAPSTLHRVPSASNTPPASSVDGEFAKFASNSNQRSMPVYKGGHGEESLTRQLVQIFSTNPNFEVHLEKGACMIPTSTTPTQSSHLSCISVEGNLLTNGNMPPGPQTSLQPAMASMEEHMKASSANLAKRKCPSISEADDSTVSKCGNVSSKCHCAKRRKLKKKSTVRVPAISDKIAEIPQDNHSWRKYGQKPIKGSPYPRGYYKCSGVKGCPAKKHVERALDDPSMLIITYEGEHDHSMPTL